MPGRRAVRARAGRHSSVGVGQLAPEGPSRLARGLLGQRTIGEELSTFSQVANPRWEGCPLPGFAGESGVGAKTIAPGGGEPIRCPSPEP